MVEYEPVVGLEIHVRINSKSKLFCRCSNDTFSASPNTHVCPTCMGFPGTLPKANREAIEKGILAALALGCSIPAFSKFDRKSYFYPDLPKGFQISQYNQPVSEKGKLGHVTIQRLHLEDDAGKLTHQGRETFVDFNRSGSPLMEIVSGPDMKSIEEASLYARRIQQIVRYVNASDADMEKGQMRFDINISLRPKGASKMGTKVEVKNLNSFRSLERALAYEIQRQKQMLDNHGHIVQETRGWDDEKGVTVSQRSKEEAADYRYFPEPDLPPLLVTREMIQDLKKQIPELPEEKQKRYKKEFELSDSVIAELTKSVLMADYFEKAVRVSGDPLKTAHWILSELMGVLNQSGIGIEACGLAPENLGRLVGLIGKGMITGKIAKEIFPEVYKKNADPNEFIKKTGLQVMEDRKELETICRQVVQQNAQSVTDFKAGKEKALGALVGQVMAKTSGKANPKEVNEILRSLLTSN